MHCANQIRLPVQVVKCVVQKFVMCCETSRRENDAGTKSERIGLSFLSTVGR